jgi:hypothetical protein
MLLFPIFHEYSILFAVLTEDEHSPNADTSRSGAGGGGGQEYESELVKSEANNSATGTSDASALALATATSSGGEIDRSSSSAVQSADGYTMQRYGSTAGTGTYDTSQYSQYGQYGYGTGAATYPMTPLGASFLYPHLYSAGHTAAAAGLHHGQHGEAGLVDEYAVAAAAAAAAAQAAGSEALTGRSGQELDHSAYSHLGGEQDDSQTGPIRGGYLKSEHGVWRPY